MKGDWDDRARKNARYYIATNNFESEEDFSSSGKRDVGHFFSDLEHLLGGDVRALDLGCGIGRMDEFVAPGVGQLVGLDVSGEMVSRARTRLAHIPNVEFVEGDGVSLEVFPEASFDLVFSHIVFQHAPREVFAGYLPEIFRVLKPTGSFVFQLPEAVNEDPPDPPQDDTFNLRFHREAKVREQLEEAGFAWESCKRFAVVAPVPVDHLRIHVVRP
jgi:ubiquinone/menaquinone biosynthesis C-methylase UbiE